jgi:ABC-type bacteriocin/lantibiotic exporter with double-glycine peptidase domain
MLKAAQGYLEPLKELKQIENSSRDEEFYSLNSIPINGPLLVDFKDVQISFANEGPALLHLFNLQLYDSDFVVITGKSGGGKSTFLDLCMGAEYPTSGTVEIRKAISDSGESVDQIISYVPQKTYLVNGSLLENIAFGIDPSLIEVNRVLKLLELVELNQLAASYIAGGDFHLLQKIQLSGGETQRIGLARALYRNPDILLLDEFTSAIEPDLEDKILRNLKEYFTGKLIIATTHRQSILQHCNRRLSVEDGFVTEIN